MKKNPNKFPTFCIFASDSKRRNTYEVAIDVISNHEDETATTLYLYFIVAPIVVNALHIAIPFFELSADFFTAVKFYNKWHEKNFRIYYIAPPNPKPGCCWR